MKSIRIIPLLLIAAMACNAPKQETPVDATPAQTTAGQSAVQDSESQPNIVQTAVSSPDHKTLVAALKAAVNPALHVTFQRLDVELLAEMRDDQPALLGAETGAFGFRFHACLLACSTFRMTVLQALDTLQLPLIEAFFLHGSS